ncbi:MAG: DUF1059 domain-containing protein [Nitrosopumilus sp.]|nr:DUF1059 domain-containing protein [Nitrosopumilus sp.]
MTKSLSCADAGSDCGWVATAETEEELMTKATKHVEESHKELQVTPDLAKKIKSLIKDV